MLQSAAVLCGGRCCCSSCELLHCLQKCIQGWYRPPVGQWAFEMLLKVLQGYWRLVCAAGPSCQMFVSAGGLRVQLRCP